MLTNFTDISRHAKISFAIQQANKVFPLPFVSEKIYKPRPCLRKSSNCVTNAFAKLSVLYVKSHYLEFEEETDEEVEQDIADDIEIHSDNIPYAEESDFEDDAFTVGKRSNVTPEKKQENHIPKIIPKKKKAPFNVEAFAKECNAYVVKQERQEEQENLQH